MIHWINTFTDAGTSNIEKCVLYLMQLASLPRIKGSPYVDWWWRAHRS